MQTLLIVITALMLCAPLPAGAQTDGDGETKAEDHAQREALRKELEQARSEVTQAARKLARIQRELADEQVEKVRIERFKAMESREELQQSIEGRRIERIEFHPHERLAGLMRPRLGVVLGPGDGAIMIVGVTPGSGAEKAGIKAGDRLISINSQEVDPGEPGSWLVPMEGVALGDRVPVVVEREGKQIALDVAAYDPARDMHVITHDIKGPPAAPGAPGTDREVFILKGDGKPLPAPPLAPRLAGLGRHSDLITNHAGLEPYFGTGEGVIVLRIDADNPLQLQDGDVVLSIEGESVSRPVDIGRALLGRGGETVTLEVMRAGERTTLNAELPETREVSTLIQELHRGLRSLPAGGNQLAARFSPLL